MVSRFQLFTISVVGVFAIGHKTKCTLAFVNKKFIFYFLYQKAFITGG